MTKFFNFELDAESYADSKIAVDESIVNRLPDDYREFLETYVDVIPLNGETMEFKHINIEDYPFLLVYTSPRVFTDKNIHEFYPDNYFVIAGDYEFDCIFMSLNGDNFGHVYYMSLVTWQDYVMGQPIDVQSQNIKLHAIHIADSFTEFTLGLSLFYDVDIKYEIN